MIGVSYFACSIFVFVFIFCDVQQEKICFEDSYEENLAACNIIHQLWCTAVLYDLYDIVSVCISILGIQYS